MQLFNKKNSEKVHNECKNVVNANVNRESVQLVPTDIQAFYNSLLSDETML